MADYKGNPKCTVKARFIGGKFWKPDEETGKRNMVLVLEDGEEDKVIKIRDQAIKETFGGKKPKGMQDWTVRVGDDEEFENSFERNFINPISRNRCPKVFTKKGSILTEVQESDDILYAGCYVYAVVDCYAYAGNPEKKIKAGVTMGIQSVVFWKNGDPIGYDGNPSDDDYDGFESEESDDEEDDDLI